VLHTVWRCPRSGDEQCTFFLWMEHEAGVQEQLKFAQPSPFQQTPIQRGASSNEPDQPAVSAGEDQYSPSQILETSFTKAKGKGMLRGIRDQDDSGDYSNHNLNGNKNSLGSTFATDDPFTHFQNTRERLQERHYLLLEVGPLQRGRRIVQRHYRPPTHAIAWLRPTARLSQLQLLQSADTSPMPGRFF